MQVLLDAMTNIHFHKYSTLEFIRLGIFYVKLMKIWDNLEFTISLSGRIIANSGFAKSPSIFMRVSTDCVMLSAKLVPTPTKSLNF